MPIFLASLLGGLINIAGTLAGRVMIALGFQLVVFTGLELTLEWLKTSVIAEISGLPAQVASVLGVLQVDTAITILLSAISARLVLRGLANGSITRWVAGGGGVPAP